MSDSDDTRREPASEPSDGAVGADRAVASENAARLAKLLGLDEDGQAKTEGEAGPAEPEAAPEGETTAGGDETVAEAASKPEAVPPAPSDERPASADQPEDAETDAEAEAEGAEAAEPPATAPAAPADSVKEEPPPVAGAGETAQAEPREARPRVRIPMPPPLSDRLAAEPEARSDKETETEAKAATETEKASAGDSAPAAPETASAASPPTPPAPDSPPQAEAPPADADADAASTAAPLPPVPPVTKAADLKKTIGSRDAAAESGETDDRAVVEARHLSLTFTARDGPVHALTDINLKIERGEFVSLIGPSGCGKTTLLRVIADLEQPTGGEIVVNGVSAAEARQARGYGYVFQAPALYPWRNVARNVALPLEIMGLGTVEMQGRIAANLELVHLTGFEKKFPWQLSGGMQQRASIARALAVEADLLLMDEPFGALDEIVRDHLNEQLNDLWRSTRKTVVFVTHSITEAVYLSTRIVVMTPRPGRIHDIIDSPLPPVRSLDVRDTPEFTEIAHRVREGLKAGHAYED